MIEKTVAELSGSLSRGDISSVELTQAYLDRINQYNSTLNAFVRFARNQHSPRQRRRMQRELTD